MNKHRLKVNRLDRESGFTLIEILIAMVILLTVAALAVPIYQNYTISAETVDAISALEAIELEVRAPAVPREGPVTCDNSLVKSANLNSNYLDLSIGSIPNNPIDYNEGFAATLHDNAAIGKEGAEGVKVANAFYQELSEKRPAQLVSGATVTQSVVSFSIILSALGDPFCDSGTMTVPANRPPVVGDLDYGHMKSGGGGFKIPGLSLLHSSHDPDGDSLQVVSVSSPDGTITIEPAYYVFHPAVGFTGIATIEFQVTDGIHTVTGKAIVEVTTPAVAVNHPPEVGDVMFSGVKSTGFKIEGHTLLRYSRDFEGDHLNILSVTTSASIGTIDSQHAPNSFFFVPAPGLVGDAVLHFQVSDGHNTVVGKATLVVDPPVPPVCTGGQQLSVDQQSCECPSGENWDTATSSCKAPVTQTQSAQQSHPACRAACRSQYPHGNSRAYRNCVQACQ